MKNPRNFRAVNSSDRDWTRQRFVLWFGVCGSTHLLVWANHLEDALDEAIDWLADNAPGLLCDEQVQEAYDRAISEGKSEEDAYTESTVDVTTGGNFCNHIMSWEWGITLENPTRAQLKELTVRLS
jgi:hypothetical protein